MTSTPDTTTPTPPFPYPCNCCEKTYPACGKSAYECNHRIYLENEFERGALDDNLAGV